jgi:general secretion pathway protein N
MMNRRAHRSLVIGAAAVLASGAVIAVAPAMADTAEKPATAPAAQAAPGGNPVHGIPIADLNVTRDRPLFAPSRRPPPPPAPAPIYQVASVSKPVKIEPERPPLTLVGTIVGGNEAIAVFLDRTSRDVVRLHTSESHEGWVLRSIQGREVTLEKDSNSTVLALAPPGALPEVATAQATPEQIRRPRR